MTIDELCELPVESIVQDDAVLFLWITSPLLCERPEALSPDQAKELLV
jgi:N6-adenosine-specific RNA methylase IME4